MSAAAEPIAPSTRDEKQFDRVRLLRPKPKPEHSVDEDEGVSHASVSTSPPADPIETLPMHDVIQLLRTPVPRHGAQTRTSAGRRVQEVYGNRFVQRLVNAEVVQRQCACGGTCARCREEEAQRSWRAVPSIIQRWAATGTSTDFDRIPTSGGGPLDAAMRGPLEAHFGADLNDVRVHTSAEAANSAASVDALAYTSGRDIYFAAGVYSPTSDFGRRVLAHEVAHVVQQGSGKEPTIAMASRGVKIGAPDDALEAEADQAAGAFMSGTPLTDEEERKRREAGGSVQRFIQRQAPQTTAPPVVATKVERRISVGTAIRHEFLAISVDLDDTTAPAFDADPGMISRLGSYLGGLFNPPEGPVPETTRFLMGTRVKTLIERDLPTWIAGNALPLLAGLLAARAAAIRKQRVRVELEASLGVPTGSIDWNAQIPLLRSELPALTGSTVTAGEASKFDRTEMFLHMLEAEVAGTPPVEGAITPANLAASIFQYATTVVRYNDEIGGLFGEKFLTPYLDQIANIRFVPDSFDLSRFAPSGTDIAESRRNQLIDAFIRDQGADLTAQFILDQWTVSGRTPENFVSSLDIDNEEAAVVDYLVNQLFLRAGQDLALASAVREIAADKARYNLLAIILGFARDIERRNYELPALANKDVFSLESDDRAIVDDPATYFQTCWNLANATTAIFNNVTAGANVAEAAIQNAAEIAGRGDIPKNFAGIVALLSLANSLLALKRTVDEQLARSRERIASEIRLSWSQITGIINSRAKAADDYVQNVWVPKLKAIALQRVQANYEDLKGWLDKFDTETPKVVGRYQLAASALEEVANKLESGEADSAELQGQVLERKDVKQVRAAVAYLRAKAKNLATQEGQEDKKKELQKAVDAFADVKAGIQDGTYKPIDFGPSVYEQARRELGIGEFEPFTTMGAAITRTATASRNPFQNWAIARWQFTERYYEKQEQLKFFALVFTATVASFLLPGVTEAILGALGVGFGVASAAATGVAVAVGVTDIGVGVVQGVKGVQQARATLDLARLDPDLSIQGVSVEEAEAALRHAWIALFITLALAGIFGAILGRAAYKGIQAVRLPFLTKLSDADPLLASKIVDASGSTKVADTLLRHFGGDALKAQEALAYVEVGKGEQLIGVIERVKDADLARRLLVAAGHEANLTPLLADFKNYAELEVLLGKANPEQLTALYDVVKSEVAVAKLLDAMDIATAEGLLGSGLSSEQALAINSLGVDSVNNYFRLLAIGDKGTQEGVLELLRLNKKGTYSNADTAAAIAKTADFMTKYGGRAAGDFVSRFSRIAQTEAEVGRLSTALADAKAAGKETAEIEANLAEAQTAAGRAKSEVQKAEDILEGRSLNGPDRTVTALREREGIGTPEFRVSGGGQPDRLVEVKAVGSGPDKPIGKNALAANFGDAAGQIADQSLGGVSKVSGVPVPGTGERQGFIRLDASRTGILDQTNEEIRSSIARKWGSILKAKPERAGTVRWVEIVDTAADGSRQTLLLEISEKDVSIVPGGTTRIDPVK